MSRRAAEGSATVEFALLLPAVVLLVGLLAVTAHVGVTRVACADAARVAARSVSVGVDRGQVVSRARDIAGAGAQVSIESDADWVQVVVIRRISGPLGTSLVIRETALARREE